MWEWSRSLKQNDIRIDYKRFSVVYIKACHFPDLRPMGV